MFDALLRGFQPGYVVPVLAGLALAVLFPSGKTIRDPRTRRIYTILQLATLIGALVGAKLAAIVGDLGWPLRPVDGPEAILSVGRSITGALLFGFLTAEILKPVLGYEEPPNDRFATVLPFSIAIGRTGCLMVGCCAGRPTDFPLALADAEGVMRHPAALYDLLFHVALGITFIVLLRRELLPGRLFAVHLLSYGAFRFAIEPLRDTPVLILGMSAYQLIALALIACGIFGITRRLPQGTASGSQQQAPIADAPA